MNRLIYRLALLGGSAAVVGFLCGLALLHYPNLPDIRGLESYRPRLITRLFADDGEILHQFAKERRILIRADEIPEPLKQAIIAVEDSRFYAHIGVDLIGTARAALRNIRAGEIVEGGSTLTQQLARLLFLTPEKTFIRKAKEAILAIQIERDYTKEQIFTLYANQVYLGAGRYGVQAAAKQYFGKTAQELNLVESALLAGVIQNPSGFNPLEHLEQAQRRRDHVLKRMFREDFLSQEELERALQEPVELNPPREEYRLASYFVEEIRKYLEARYGPTILYTNGLKVHTTLNLNYQRAAEKAVREGLLELDKRQGYRGPIENVLESEDTSLEEYHHPDWERRIEPDMILSGLVSAVDEEQANISFGEYSGILDQEGMSWTGKFSPMSILKQGDLSLFRILDIDREDRIVTIKLEQEPEVEGALLAVDPSTGAIKAMVGGYDFNRSMFNRAVQAKRQSGSAFKPIIYTAALDNGYTISSRIFDEPTQFIDRWTGMIYQPENYSETYHGLTTLREALEESRNVFSVRLLNHMGYQLAIEYAQRLGITTPVPPYPSIVLGAAEVTLQDMVTVYGVFANRGVRVRPRLFNHITDYEENVIERSAPDAQQALSPETAYLMVNLLQGVIERGTGSAARGLGPATAGKTGTTDGYTDAWFLGFTPTLVAGVWVGFDLRQTLGSHVSGAVAALPIWKRFMEAVIQHEPRVNFELPKNIIKVPIDSRSGKRATIDSHCSTVILGAFRVGSEPQMICSQMTHELFELPWREQKARLEEDDLYQIPPKLVPSKEELERLLDGRMPFGLAGFYTLEKADGRWALTYHWQPPLALEYINQ